MKPWERLAENTAPDGEVLELRRRDQEYLILAGGYDLMSSKDEASSRALGEMGCGAMESRKKAHVLIGGLGMGYTARAALDACGPAAKIDVAELVPCVADWNREHLAHLAGNPLADPRLRLHVVAVQKLIRGARGSYDSILLDVDNGPDALAHRENSQLYSTRGIDEAWKALRVGGILGVWSFSDDEPFTKRLEKRGFTVERRRTEGSRSGRGRYHWIWIARRMPEKKPRPRDSRPAAPKSQTTSKRSARSPAKQSRRKKK